jgi:Tfp pilus assembly protein PilN
MKAVNLIPQDQRRRSPSDGSGKGAYAVLGVLAVLLVMVVGYVLASNTVTERQGEVETARAEADQLEAQSVQESGFVDFAQVAQTRTQSVAGVAGGRFDWERFLRELSRVMPEGSWLRSADASVLGDPAGTATVAPDPAAAATPVGPAANLVGCTPDQDDVARMMVRLSQMHRVQDVELNESIAGTAADETTIDSCGPLYTFNLTVKFNPAQPAREAPRGSTGVPASLGGGS